MVVESHAVLMSIRKPFSSAILEGRKLVELRRVPLRRHVSHVIIYESGGTGQIVGVFEVKRIVEDRPSRIWKIYNGNTGLTRKEFDAYYRGKYSGVAIEVGRVLRLDTPLSLFDLSLDRPPQSFQYVCASVLRHLLDIGLPNEERPVSTPRMD